MKIRALVNGDVIDVSEQTASELIAAGIYEAVNEPQTSTKVEPLTTKDSPSVRKTRGR
jgi:hypothetical protein